MERGLLDLSVQLSTRNITAGNEFALFVLATNPFDKPVWIREVNVSLPSELKLANEREAQEEIKEEQKRRETDSKVEDERLGETRKETDRLLKRLDELSLKQDSKEYADELSSLRELIEERVAFVKKKGHLNVGVDGEAKVDIVRIGSSAANIGISGESKVGLLEIYDSQLNFTLTRTVKLRSSLPDGVALQPGSTVVYTVVLNVEKSLIFTPTQYRLQFNVNYSFTPEISKTTENAPEGTDEIMTNTIAHELSIRPSVYSLIIGAMIGGFIGSLAKMLQIIPVNALQNFTIISIVPSLVKIAVAVILSGMAIIFMARKSDAQSFVSIEDFWGGLLIGFLVGYTGTSFFESITGVTALVK